jgi:predicted DNA-binding protein
MTKTLPFSMRLRPEMKAALQRLADADRRSLTNYVEAVLYAHIEEKERKPEKRK